METENDGGALIAFHTPAGLLENAYYVIAFDLVEGTCILSRAWHCGSCLEGLIDTKGRVGGEDNCSFDDVLKLTDVSRPIVPLKGILHIFRNAVDRLPELRGEPLH